MSALPLTGVTPEQYLEADRAAEFRSEYYDGVMYAMSGASYAHNVINHNFASALGQALRKRGCTVTSADQRVRVSPQRAYAYPDTTVVCGAPRFADDQADTLLNPVIIIEVLSQSTEAQDRGLKFARYREIESLRDYVLVSRLEPRVEKFTRQPDGTWLFSESIGWNAICRFDSLDCDIPLATIYENVALRENEG